MISLLDISSSDDQKTVALLGLSFKANTDDIRNAPSIAIIKALTEKGIIVHAYDPKATHNMKKLFPHIYYFDSPYEAIKDADCIVALTEWEEIKNIDFDKVVTSGNKRTFCNQKILVDTRNIYDIETVKKYNFTYLNMGLL